MAIAIFKSFRSTITPFLPRNWFAAVQLLVDPTTGAPVGIQNFNDAGPDGIWTPVDVTAAQLEAPTAAMLAVTTDEPSIPKVTPFRFEKTTVPDVADCVPALMAPIPAETEATGTLTKRRPLVSTTSQPLSSL